MSDQNLPLLLLFPDYVDAGIRIATTANLPYEILDVHQFPDQEYRIKLPEHLPKKVIFCQSLNEPNSKLIALMLASQTARDLGANYITLLAPYMCYMRQDTAFHPGEAISQLIVGQFLANYFDSVITVDPHLHRVHDFNQAVPTNKSIALSAQEPISQYIAENIEAPFLLGPDEESYQWVAAIANTHGFDFAVATKQRSGDRDVKIQLPDLSITNRHIVIIDDIASTGHTIATTANAIAKLSPTNITVIVTHALFVGDAVKNIKAAGVSEIWSTDSVSHPSNRIDLSNLYPEVLIIGNAH